MAKIGTLIKRDTDFISLNMTPNALVKALRNYGLTASKVIAPIAEALEAKKLIVHNGDNADDSWTEEVIDYPTRLKAAQIGIDLLGLKKNAKLDIKETGTFNKELNKAMKNMNEVELQRAVFKKSE
jgi:uncharacterized membrane protein